jgi:hypothetical protein
MSEHDVVTTDLDCKATSHNSSLSDRLQSILESAREVNKLGEGRVPLGTAFAKKQDVTPKKTLKVRRWFLSSTLLEKLLTI